MNEATIRREILILGAEDPGGLWEIAGRLNALSPKETDAGRLDVARAVLSEPVSEGVEWSGRMRFQGVAEASLESTMWTPTTRRRYSRTGLRYASDLTDAEWALIEPLLPAACGRGRPRSWPWREIVDAIFYVLRGGIAWRLLPTDFPPWQTV
jgi:hypothetical protein